MARDPRFQRRTFLRWSAGSAGAAACSGLLPWRSLVAAGAAGDRVLVLLELNGGNDGLNTVVPFGDDLYAKARGRLALPAADVLRAGDGVGFHPALAGLRRLFDAGRVAVVEGCGYPDPIRSHFLSTDVWHTAHLEGRRAGAGWVARLADAAFQGDDPNAVVALGPRVPYACEGAEHRAVALTSPATYRVLGDERVVETLDAAVAEAPADVGPLSSGAVSDRARSFLRQAYLDARASSDAVRAAVRSFRPGAEYPANSRLAQSLRTVAALVAGGLGTRVFHVPMGGFDTHSGQEGRHRALLAELGDALAAFQEDLTAHGEADRVLVVLYSEFGRRVEGNGSGGTDHGTAGPMFVVGEAVRGGLHGERPRLDRLDENGDLVFTTDFRRVYATVIERWIGADATAVLGESFAPLDILPPRG